MSAALPPEPARVPSFLKISLVLLHAVGMNFLFFLPILLVVAPIVGSMWYMAVEFWTREPMLAALGSLVGLGAVASAFRVWLRLQVH